MRFSFVLWCLVDELLLTLAGSAMIVRLCPLKVLHELGFHAWVIFLIELIIIRAHKTT